MVITTAKDMKDFISQHAIKLSEEKVSPANGNAVANLIGKYIQVVKLETMYQEGKNSGKKMTFYSEETPALLE